MYDENPLVCRGRLGKITSIIVKAAMCLGAVGAALLVISPHSSHNAPQTTVEAEITSYTTPDEEPLKIVNLSVSEATSETSEPKQQSYLHYEYTNADADMLARLVLREAGGCAKEEQRLVIWTVFQRVDSTDHDFRNMNTIADVVTAPHQFAYDESAPIKDEIRRLCEAELEKWVNGGTPPTVEPYAPTLPYLFFEGDGYHNWFKSEW